jgi:capsule polysaccharide export protein KpsE/RkpR
MAKLHFVRKARRAYRKEGIRKDQPYWWWYGPKPRKHGRGATIRCNHKPRRSVYMTSSEYLKRMMDLEDDCGLIDSENGAEGLEIISGEVRELGEECQSKLDSVQSRFPNGCPSAETLQSRVEQCESIASELERAANEISEESTEEEIKDIIGGVEWSYS